MLSVRTALLLALINLAVGEPTTPQRGDPLCGDIMRTENLTYEFPAIVAHGIHSLTLNAIRYFFNPFAGEDNGIPVVNLNLTHENSILANAPFIILNNSFSLPAQFAFDYILSHMDDENYGMKNANPLDSMAHALHMQEMWTKAAPYYQNIKEIPPTDPGFCSCVENTSVINIGTNSIDDFIQYLAKQIRTPELMYKGYKEGSESTGKGKEKGKGKWKGKGKGTGKGKGKGKGKGQGKGKSANNRRAPIYVYRGNYGGGTLPGRGSGGRGGRGGGSGGGGGGGRQALRSGNKEKKEKSLPNIENEAAWKLWKDAMELTGDALEAMSYQLSLFLYCKLE